ncbi:MAG: protein kinase [Deltaproteobacteria bacterium]|nr:protein kinase [Deltaproteobacteria bacterium]
MTQAPPAPKGDKVDDRIGAVLAGRYKIMRVLGTGGMGSVYEAMHTTTDKRVAIKLLSGHLSKDLKLVARFRREAMAASRLDHENCVSVDDFGEDKDGTFYIAMELVPGRGLADELRASGPMPAARVARIGVQLLKALDSAHLGGVLHRDLKPQNVMLAQKIGRPDMVKVVDFGIAKITNNDASDQQALTIPGTIFGTPEYMSPEQARGDPLDARSDLYSASVVLWHMLLGRSPFRGTSVRDTLLKVFSEEAQTTERPGFALPPGFEAVLRKGMAKAKEDRWPDAATYANALAPFADGVVVDLPQRARPGLMQDGSAPPPTLDAMPAVNVARVAPVARRDTVPLPEAPASISPATEAQTRFGSPSLFIAPQPAGSAGHPHPGQPPQPRVAPPPPPLRQPLAQPPPAAQPVPMSAGPPPVIPEGAPKAARVLGIDTVKQQTTPGKEPKHVEAPVERAPSPISIAGIVVVVGGLLLLGGFVFVAVLVVQGKLFVAEQAGSNTVIGAPVPVVVAEPVAPVDPNALQKALAGEVPLDPLARDAALGRAERAIAENRPVDARKAFEEAIAADPTAPPALIGLATLSMQSKDFATARDCFEKLMSIDRIYRKQFGPMYARAKKLADAPKE